MRIRQYEQIFQYQWFLTQLLHDRPMASPIETLFKTQFNLPTLWVKAPGRINLIGEHTDYNEGWVLPAAIDKSITLAFAPNNSSTVRIHALDRSDSFNYSLSTPPPSPSGWRKYIVGMTNAFLQPGQGFNCVFGGDLPIGAGMSSSSALCCGLAFGFNQLFQLGYDKRALTPLVQRAESECSGVNGGIMDQFSILLGQSGKAILLDCRDLSTTFLPLILDNLRLLLCNTGVEHQLAATEYNTRRQECNTGVALLQKGRAGIKSLRDITAELLDKYRSEMPPPIYQRCKYVVEENERVRQAALALQNGELKLLGQLLYQSHEGLQHQYEVSCPELDFLVAFAKTQPYVAGARMMGGGFGGCTLNLLPKDKVDAFVELTKAAYRKRFGLEMAAYEVTTADGCSVIQSPPPY